MHLCYGTVISACGGKSDKGLVTFTFHVFRSEEGIDNAIWNLRNPWRFDFGT